MSAAGYRHCRPIVLASIVATVALSLLATGCSGGGSAGVASVAPTTTVGTTAETTTVESGSVAGALTFARCMRSQGIPNWPDPPSSGVFDKSKLRQLGVSPARVRAIEERSCNYVFENGGQGQTITPVDQVDYLRAAACMRSHGFPRFPDPTFQNGAVRVDIPSNIDEDSSKFRSAATTCTRLIPAGLPYSRPSGS
jgi:hypothetical protein